MQALFKFFMAGIITLGGCATAIRGTSHEFRVESEPPGAKVTTTLETKASAKARKIDPDIAPIYHGCPATPCTFVIPRRSQFIARIERPEFVPVTVTVRSKTGGDKMAASTLGNAGVPSTGLGVVVTSELTIASTAVGTTVGSFGGLAIGAPMIFVDYTSGSIQDTYPNPIRVNLIPKSESDVSVIHIDTDAIKKAMKAAEQEEKARARAVQKSEAAANSN